MWRAEVIERIEPGRVVVSIPSLFRGDPVGPMQSAVDAQVGDMVVVADLRADAKVRDWWVMGYESQIGRWGSPYPHEHPLGQVFGVDANGDPIPLSTILEGKANVGDIPPEADLSGYATKTELGGYTTDSELTTALSGKAGTPGPWTTCTPSSFIIRETTPDIQVRTTPFGMQLRSGRWRYAADVPRDSVMFTLPAGFAPPTSMMFMTSGMSSAATDYAALHVHLELRTSGQVTARSAHNAAPLITLNQTFMY